VNSKAQGNYTRSITYVFLYSMQLVRAKFSRRGSVLSSHIDARSGLAGEVVDELENGFNSLPKKVTLSAIV